MKDDSLDTGYVGLHAVRFLFAVAVFLSSCSNSIRVKFTGTSYPSACLLLLFLVFLLDLSNGNGVAIFETSTMPVL